MALMTSISMTTSIIKPQIKSESQMQNMPTMNKQVQKSSLKPNKTNRILLLSPALPPVETLHISPVLHIKRVLRLN